MQKSWGKRDRQIRKIPRCCLDLRNSKLWCAPPNFLIVIPHALAKSSRWIISLILHVKIFYVRIQPWVTKNSVDRPEILSLTTLSSILGPGNEFSRINLPWRQKKNNNNEDRIPCQKSRRQLTMFLTCNGETGMTGQAQNNKRFSCRTTERESAAADNVGSSKEKDFRLWNFTAWLSERKL